MELKALSLSLLLLLPLVLFTAPLAQAFMAPVMWVNPNNIEKTGPCLVSSTFDVEVKLWNKKDLTHVGVYAFDFNLTWLNSTLGFTCGSLRDSFITLVNVSFRAPWDHYFIVVNETIKPFVNATDCKYYTGYHLAITALDNSAPLTDIQTVLLRLTFHIDCEPLWPDEYVTPFDLQAVLSDYPDAGTAGPISGVEIHDGTFILDSYQPDVHLEPRYFCEYKADIAHTVEFWISNMSKVYGFGFAVTFNSTLLMADLQSIQFCDAFPTPYEYINKNVTENCACAGTSTIFVEMVRPCEKPSVTHQPGPAATFRLVSKFDGFDSAIIPNKDDSNISLHCAYVLSKCGCNGTGCTRTYGYNLPCGCDYPLLAYNTTITYYWRPRIGDLNLDGAVDIQDMQALSTLYGIDTGALNTWGNLDGRGLPAIVDIFDFVVIAKYFGKPYTCDIADP